jgi:hypothetical protein
MIPGVAHADPRFALTESQARAGEPVHFSISGAEGRVDYGLEVGDIEVLEGTSTAKVVTGQFTMPDLGAAGRTVTVEARIREPDDTTTVRRSLEYLAPAPPPPAPVATPPAPAPTAVAQAQPPPEPIHSVVGGKAPPRPKRAGKPHAQRPPQNAEKRRAGTRRPSTTTRRQATRGRAGKRKKARHRRAAPRTAPLFDGVPESPAGPGTDDRGGGFLALNAIFPPTTASIPSPGSGPDGGLSAAVLVPALLGLAALMLAGATLARRRRLAAANAAAGDERLGSLTRVARSGAELRRGIARRATRRMRDGD